MENCFETLPFCLLQIYVIALESDYNLTLCVSLFFSLLSSGVMTATVITKATEVSFTFELLHVMLWTSDVIVRVVPLAFIFASYNDYILTIAVVTGVFASYFIFFWMLLDGYECIMRLLNCFGCTVILFVSSIVKFLSFDLDTLSDAKKDALLKHEMVARFVFSCVLVLHLKKRDDIGSFQLGAFMLNFCFSWGGQIIFYYGEKVGTSEFVRQRPLVTAQQRREDGVVYIE